MPRAGETHTYIETGLPSGLGAALGVQVRDAVSGLVKSARTTQGIVEQPPGTGAYAITVTAPAEGGVYSSILDFKNGVLDEDARVEEVRVAAVQGPQDVSLGPIAQRARRYLAEAFDLLIGSTHYGTAHVQGVTETVKRTWMQNPPDIAAEEALPDLVIDFLGANTALELIPAARQLMTRRAQTITTGDDPTEIVSYPDALKALEQTQTDLMVKVERARPHVLPLLGAAMLLPNSDGPSIDEISDDARVTDDPRTHPRFGDCSGRRRTVMPS